MSERSQRRKPAHPRLEDGKPAADAAPFIRAELARLERERPRSRRSARRREAKPSLENALLSGNPPAHRRRPARHSRPGTRRRNGTRVSISG
ncbi:MAG: hypothetical protein HY554_05445 [Elusimicrobia bacterium]|nr:hypothetical protein [Elusimicrobiota bacterium]